MRPPSGPGSECLLKSGPLAEHADTVIASDPMIAIGERPRNANQARIRVARIIVFARNASVSAEEEPALMGSATLLRQLRPNTPFRRYAPACDVASSIAASVLMSVP